MNGKVGKKKLNIFQNAMNSKLAGMVVQLVQKVWDALTNSCSPGLLRAFIEPCT